MPTKVKGTRVTSDDVGTYGGGKRPGSAPPSSNPKHLKRPGQPGK